MVKYGHFLNRNFHVTTVKRRSGNWRASARLSHQNGLCISTPVHEHT